MINTIAAVATAVAALAGLVVLLYTDRLTARARWEKRYAELNEQWDRAKKAHEMAVARGTGDAMALYDQWLQVAKELSRHRGAGQRAGYLSRS
ncbi:MAG TPA: hypothetical protein PLL20_19400 [Phycisphaerae bacterium]|nr:hypothetical protein [Phycisphaerae bacterium]